MGKKYTLEEHQAHVEAEEKRKAADAQARREWLEKEAARRAWVADGGREADFEAAWPRLRDEDRSRRVIGADQRAREASRQFTHNNF